VLAALIRQIYILLTRAVDAQILQDGARMKIDIAGRMEGVLGGKIKAMVTQCDMRHLYSAKPKDEALITQVKNDYERKRCNHHELENPLSSLECLSECIDPKASGTNKHRYVVATQDPKIRARMRRIPGVPLIYVNKSVMILEPMAAATENVRDREERAKFKAGLKGRREANTGEKRSRDGDEEEEVDEDEETRGQSDEPIVKSTGDARPQKKKRTVGPKAPNPLSVKKAKKQPPLTPNNTSTKPKSTVPDVPQVLQVDEKSIAEDGEAAKSKRKRKHKSKADGVATAHTEVTVAS
jgi:U3 small nucleolar RNA-associated protein 23